MGPAILDLWPRVDIALRDDGRRGVVGLARRRVGKTIKAAWIVVFQWLLNVLWTPLFFGMHRAGLAYVEIVALWCVLTATLGLFWRVKKTAGLLLVPYLVWVTFAAALNFTLWHMNR